jgi:hypothetical protein
MSSHSLSLSLYKRDSSSSWVWVATRGTSGNGGGYPIIMITKKEELARRTGSGRPDYSRRSRAGRRIESRK